LRWVIFRFQEVERDIRGLLRGTKDGEITIRNESDQVVKGEKVVIDNTHATSATIVRKPRGGVKIVERGTVLFGRTGTPDGKPCGKFFVVLRGA